MPTEKSVCQNPRCARPYTKVRGNQKFCSDRCRIQHFNSHKNKGKTCKWCGERFPVTFETLSRSYCYKTECIQKQWFWGLILRYDRCKDCHSIIPRGRPPWRSQHYCAFCVGSVRKEIRKKYVEWLKNLPRYVNALLPNPMITLKTVTQYVKNYDVNNPKFQIFYPHKKEE